MDKTKAKILVIDDDPDFLDAVSSILEASHYDVQTASDAKEGSKKVSSVKPDLILMDIMMDSLFDGFSLCHSLKTSKEFNQIPIIFVSAVKAHTGSRFQFQTDDQGMKGPDDYLDKPVKPEDLLSRIERLLSRETFAVT